MRVTFDDLDVDEERDTVDEERDAVDEERDTPPFERLEILGENELPPDERMPELRRPLPAA